MNLIPPIPKEQNPTQMQKEEESIRMAKAESLALDSACSPTWQGAHQRRSLPDSRPGFLRAFATGHSWWCNER